MRWSRAVTLVEAHAEGEVGRVVTGGILGVPGGSMLERLRWFNEHDTELRRFLTHEPRGAAQMSTNLLFPPSTPDADAGYLILQGDQAHAMSGSNSICVTTVLLETGILPMVEPQTVVRLETPAGIVTARATCVDGKCESVTLDMTPAYVHSLDAIYDVAGLGAVSVDIAFGGVFYALVDAKALGLSIRPEEARKLVETGLAIHRAVAAGPRIAHPEIDGIEGLSYVMFTERRADGTLVGSTMLPPGRLDRSPCGTGNAARMATMVARSEAEVGDRYEARSIIDSRFDVEIAGAATVAGHPGVHVRVTGRGWIHGMHTLGLDPTDPYPAGFTVADCWGGSFEL